MWFTLLIIGASVSLSLSEVRRAVFSDQMAVFGEEAVEEGPAAIAAFIHVITRHQILSRKLWHFLAILDLHSVLSDLSERDCVAGAAVTLVPVFIHEIIASNVSPVEIIR